MKNTRIWWRITAATINVAAHLCTLRIYQPNATSLVMVSTEAYAVVGEAS